MLEKRYGRKLGNEATGQKKIDGSFEHVSEREGDDKKEIVCKKLFSTENLIKRSYKQCGDKLHYRGLAELTE